MNLDLKLNAVVLLWEHVGATSWRADVAVLFLGLEWVEWHDVYLHGATKDEAYHDAAERIGEWYEREFAVVTSGQERALGQPPGQLPELNLSSPSQKQKTEER